MLMYVHIPKEIRSKLDFKTKRCIMIGYSVNGYRLWDNAQNKVIIARDVLFNESVVQQGISLFDDGIQNVNENESDLRAIVEDKETEETGTEKEEQKEGCDVPQKRSRNPSSWHSDYDFSVLALNADAIVDVPQDIADVETSPEKEKWEHAIQEEYKSLMKNETWELVQPQTEMKILDNKWVFKVKKDETGRTNKYKARLVVKGYLQRQRIDYEETFAPVAKLTTIRTLIALAIHEELYLDQMDVKTAFLNGNLDDDIYMHQPKGMEK